jgi:hypothetical protein
MGCLQPPLQGGKYSAPEPYPWKPSEHGLKLASFMFDPLRFSFNDLQKPMRLHSSSKPLGPIGRFCFGRIFPLPFLIVGAIFLLIGLRSMQRAQESTNWPSVAAVIVSSSVDSRSGNKGTTYQAKVLYDYTVDGTQYSSNRIGYGDYGSSNPGHAREVVNQYPKGSKVEVFYMPDHPEESVLEPGIHLRTYFIPAFGAVFLFAGAGMFIFLPRILRKQAEQAHARQSQRAVQESNSLP